MTDRESIGRSATRALLCGSLLAGVIQGQESISITFDPRETGELTWMSGVGLFSICCALYALWTVLIGFLQKHRATLPWHALRFYLPTMTLSSAWLVFGVARSSRLSLGGAGELLLGIFALANLPGVLVGGLTLTGVDLAPGWLQFILGSAGWWVGWHAAVRLAEWKAWVNVPVALKIEEEGS
jgi:hypothetical protein